MLPSTSNRNLEHAGYNDDDVGYDMSSRFNPDNEIENDCGELNPDDNGDAQAPKVSGRDYEAGGEEEWQHRTPRHLSFQNIGIFITIKLHCLHEI